MVNIDSDQTVSIVDPFSANNNNNSAGANSNNNNGAAGMVGDSSPTQGAANYGSPVAGSAGYSFQGKPRSIQKNRSSQNEENRPVNIMHDKRVYRGNTYASPVVPANAQQDPVNMFKQQEVKRKSEAKKRSDSQKRPKTPEAVAGRKHIDIQTELYLEELANKIPEAHNSTQTDDFLDRAPSPLFIPQKSGIDAATQIEHGELFDFGVEVEPILQVVVGKTLEQAVMELMEERELEILRRHQEEYERRRTAELVETQRMEEAEKRRAEEKARRLLDEQRAHQRAQVAAEKLAARSFVQSYMSNMVGHVHQSLKEYGVVRDDIEENVLTAFLPWLSGKVLTTLQRERLARLVVDNLILDALQLPRAP